MTSANGLPVVGSPFFTSPPPFSGLDDAIFAMNPVVLTRNIFSTDPGLVSTQPLAGSSDLQSLRAVEQNAKSGLERTYCFGEDLSSPTSRMLSINQERTQVIAPQEPQMTVRPLHSHIYLYPL